MVGNNKEKIVRWEKNGKFFLFYGGRMLMHKLGKQGGNGQKKAGASIRLTKAGLQGVCVWAVGVKTPAALLFYQI